MKLIWSKVSIIYAITHAITNAITNSITNVITNAVTNAITSITKWIWAKRGTGRKEGIWVKRTFLTPSFPGRGSPVSLEKCFCEDSKWLEPNGYGTCAIYKQVVVYIEGDWPPHFFQGKWGQ